MTSYKPPKIFGPVEIDPRSILIDDNGDRVIMITNVDFEQFFGKDGPCEITNGNDSVAIRLKSIGDVVAYIKRVQEYTVSNTSIVSLKMVVQFADYRMNDNLIDVTPKPVPLIKYKNLLFCIIRITEEKEAGITRQKEAMDRYSKILFDGTVFNIIKDAQKIMIKGKNDLSNIEIPEAGIYSYATSLIYSSEEGPASEKDMEAITELYRQYTTANKSIV